MDDEKIKELVPRIFEEGGFGIEEESLRVTEDGYIAQTKHPFQDPAIDRDFCENQVEIITPVCGSVQEAYDSLLQYRRLVKKTIRNMPDGREFLWPCSNPAYVRSEAEIPIASFGGDLAWKTEYREYLAGKYGKVLMLLSGIHFNYSYPEFLLRELFAESSFADFRAFSDHLYLKLAEKSVLYSWLIVGLTAASPLTDSSYWEPGKLGGPGKDGFASVRSSEVGYWNRFTPVLDYRDIASYKDSIDRYVHMGELQSPAELYYPIRLKPKGIYHLEKLLSGISHIEFRMIDLNPLSEACIMIEDIRFITLLILWMTLTPEMKPDPEQQENAIYNMKAAGRAPMENVMIRTLDGRNVPMVRAAMEVLGQMESCFGSLECLHYQKEKLIHPEKRYTEIIRKRFGDGYVRRVLEMLRTEE